MYLLPTPWENLAAKIAAFIQPKANRYKVAIILDVLCIILIVLHGGQGIDKAQQIISPILSPLFSLNHQVLAKSEREVFGFAPYWSINADKLDNVDFNTLTTFAYFGIEVASDGSFVQDDPGYQTFYSNKTKALFTKAHNHGTRTVITYTQMDNDTILAFLDNSEAQAMFIRQAIKMVRENGVEGINIDFEYAGNPGQNYKDAFTRFISALTTSMHNTMPDSQVSVSVYASAIIDPKIYDIKALSKNNIMIFMMAYDFAVAGSDEAFPTAPLYGHKEKKYWYDVSTAVEDFLKVMPAEKLILGVPYYGYNYLPYEPTVKAETRPYYSWKGTPHAQTYSVIQNEITPATNGVTEYRTGWDNDGKVAYKAYYDGANDTWRMIFYDDKKALGLKYDYAKKMNLGGVGMWALGFDDGKDELWQLLREKFGPKFADTRIQSSGT